MSKAKEITRTEHFTDGDVTCPCGRTFHLWWNGGELDEELCACGRYYRTEHVRVDLVVYDKRPGEA